MKIWQKLSLFAFAILIVNFKLLAQEDIEFFEEYFSLNSKHQLLSQFVGDWKVNIAYFSSQGEDYAKGKLQSSLSYAYRILEMNFSIESSAGVAFEMKYLIGYDGISKKFFLIILNNLTNELQVLKGEYSEKNKEFLFKGTTVDSKVKKRVPFSMKIYFERENKAMIDSYVIKNGKEKLISRCMLIKVQND
jgi:hypothetical protein